MTANIDAAGGKGCAEFVRKAIEKSRTVNGIHFEKPGFFLRALKILERTALK